MKGLVALIVCFSCVVPAYAKEQPIVVCIAPGHQTHANLGKEPIGPHADTYKMKVSGGTQGHFTHVAESIVNLKVGKKLQKLLVKQGYQVVMTRTRQNVNITNKQRAQIANKAHAAIMVRLHCDGTYNRRVFGFFMCTPTFHNPYMSKMQAKNAYKLSALIAKGVKQTTKAKDRGIFKRDDLTGTNYAKMPTALIEMGEMYNRKEDHELASDAYQNKLAKGIAKGIENYFKEKRKKSFEGKNEPISKSYAIIKTLFKEVE
jgi:N-acetylmuramoyl-L-alanine amidase